MPTVEAIRSRHDRERSHSTDAKLRAPTNELSALRIAHRLVIQLDNRGDLSEPFCAARRACCCGLAVRFFCARHARHTPLEPLPRHCRPTAQVLLPR